MKCLSESEAHLDPSFDLCQDVRHQQRPSNGSDEIIDPHDPDAEDSMMQFVPSNLHPVALNND